MRPHSSTKYQFQEQEQQTNIDITNKNLNNNNNIMPVNNNQNYLIYNPFVNNDITGSTSENIFNNNNSLQ